MQIVMMLRTSLILLGIDPFTSLVGAADIVWLLPLPLLQFCGHMIRPAGQYNSQEISKKYGDATKVCRIIYDLQYNF
jgi:hypothetical protein